VDDPVDLRKAALPDRTVGGPGLTETAAVCTAAADLDHPSVLYHLNIGNKLGTGKGEPIEIRLHPPCGRMPGSIQPGLLQKPLDSDLSRETASLALSDNPGYIADSEIAIPEIKQIKKRLQRSGIIDTGPPAYYNRHALTPFGCFQRDPGELKNLKDISIGQLILQREPEEITIADRPPGLQKIERLLSLAEEVPEVGPRTEYPLTGHFRH